MKYIKKNSLQIIFLRAKARKTLSFLTEMLEEHESESLWPQVLQQSTAIQHFKHKQQKKNRD